MIDSHENKNNTMVVVYEGYFYKFPFTSNSKFAQKKRRLISIENNVSNGICLRPDVVSVIWSRPKSGLKLGHMRLDDKNTFFEVKNGYILIKNGGNSLKLQASFN